MWWSLTSSIMNVALVAVTIGCPSADSACLAFAAAVLLPMAGQFRSRTLIETLREQNDFAMQRDRFPVSIACSLTLFVGYWGGIRTPTVIPGSVGTIMVITGIGGMLGWFPIPRVSPEGRMPSMQSIHRDRLIPTVIASILLMRCTRDLLLTEKELATIAIVSLFVLLLSGLRLFGRLNQSQRLQLATLSLLSHANIATVLLGWEAHHPDWTWRQTSNLGSGDQIFWAIILIESIAIAVWSIGCDGHSIFSLSQMEREKGCEGVKTTSWFVRAAQFSVAGFLPVPGGLWRLALCAALLLPHQRSVVTHLAEPHIGFVSLAVCYAAALIVSGTGAIRSIKTS